MNYETRKRIKNIKKIDKLITKNKKEIKQILVSELFLKQIMDVAQYIDVELREEGNQEILFLFDKPINMSHFINEGCILLLENDEYVVLKGI
jgi:hypothetical protein